MGIRKEAFWKMHVCNSVLSDTVWRPSILLRNRNLDPSNHLRSQPSHRTDRRGHMEMDSAP
jgi:hypothetical protein